MGPPLGPCMKKKCILLSVMDKSQLGYSLSSYRLGQKQHGQVAVLIIFLVLPHLNEGFTILYEHLRFRENARE